MTSTISKDMENIGFTHFWGISPCIDFLDKTFGTFLTLDKKTINILLVSTSDIRHVLKTVADHADKLQDKQINIYIQEKVKEVTARQILQFFTLHLQHLNIRGTFYIFRKK